MKANLLYGGKTLKGYHRYIPFIVCSLIICSLSGCGYSEETKGGTGSYAAAAGMEGTPIVDYTVPQMNPNILVDLYGYPAEGRKEAAVKGRELPEGFRLMDSDTGTAVYYGTVSDITYDQEMGLYLGRVDFSDFTEEGSFYLECDYIGQSYRFEIEDQYFRKLFEENYEKLMEECREGTLSVSNAIVLLEAYEWYGEIFPDADSDQVPDVLSELKVWVSHMEAAGVEEQETALYAAFLAKFSYNYQKFDLRYATDCLKRASTVFGQVQTTISKDADSFFALTELYRATGLNTYRNKILDYKSYFEDNTSYLEEPEYLYGIMTYMVTRQRVDLEMCDGFMGSLMHRAEEISNRYTDIIHPVTARNNGTDDLLKRAVEVSCANYIMNNYQYTNIVEQFLHYLMGTNRDSMNFYEQDEVRAEYLLLLAQLTANEM